MNSKEKENILEQVREFADRAHGDQMRKYAPERYIAHPVRVMKMCMNYTDDTAVLAAALLHDVLEDTAVTKKQLQRFLQAIAGNEIAEKTTRLVEELTDKYVKKDYPGINRRRRKIMETERAGEASSDAQTIRYADIIDNAHDITEHDPDFAKVFLWECRALLQVINKGNPDLYEQAVAIVNKCMEHLKKAY